MSTITATDGSGTDSAGSGGWHYHPDQRRRGEPSHSAPDATGTTGARPERTAPGGGRSAPVGWLPWTNPNRPATTTDEARFVDDLRRSCDGAARPHRRTDLTAVLNALRGGLTLAEALEQAPGLDPGRLYGAYITIDELRRRAVEAWEAIEANPTPSVVDEHGDRAARLLPVQVARIRQVSDNDPRLVDATVAGLAVDIERSGRLAARIESELDHCVDRSERAVKLGVQLYDPYGECLFARSDFLPHRVGALMPQRVAELLKPHESDDDLERAVRQAMVA